MKLAFWRRFRHTHHTDETVTREQALKALRAIRKDQSGRRYDPADPDAHDRDLRRASNLNALDNNW